MDPLTLTVWVIRLAFLAALYLFLALVARTLLRDIRAASRDPAGALGRLVVIGSANLPTVGSVFLLDAVTTLGRDLGSGVVLDDGPTHLDPIAGAEHGLMHCPPIHLGPVPAGQVGQDQPAGARHEPSVVPRDERVRHDEIVVVTPPDRERVPLHAQVAFDAVGAHDAQACPGCRG